MGNINRKVRECLTQNAVSIPVLVCIYITITGVGGYIMKNGLVRDFVERRLVRCCKV